MDNHARAAQSANHRAVVAHSGLTDRAPAPPAVAMRGRSPCPQALPPGLIFGSEIQNAGRGLARAPCWAPATSAEDSASSAESSARNGDQRNLAVCDQRDPMVADLLGGCDGNEQDADQDRADQR